MSNELQMFVVEANFYGQRNAEAVFSTRQLAEDYVRANTGTSVKPGTYHAYYRVTEFTPDAMKGLIAIHLIPGGYGT